MKLETVAFEGVNRFRVLTVTGAEAAKMLSDSHGRRIAPPRPGHEVDLNDGGKIENVGGQYRFDPNRSMTRSVTVPGDDTYLTAGVLDYLRAHPALAKRQCTPAELALVDGPSHRAGSRGLRTRYNPGFDVGVGTMAAAVGIFAVALIGGAYLLRRGAGSVAPGGTPMAPIGQAGGRESGQEVALGPFTGYYEETDATGTPMAAQTVMLINNSRVVPNRWFVRLGKGQNTWADVPPA